MCRKIAWYMKVSLHDLCDMLYDMSMVIMPVVVIISSLIHSNVPTTLYFLPCEGQKSG